MRAGDAVHEEGVDQRRAQRIRGHVSADLEVARVHVAKDRGGDARDVRGLGQVISRAHAPACVPGSPDHDVICEVLDEAVRLARGQEEAAPHKGDMLVVPCVAVGKARAVGNAVDVVAIVPPGEDSGVVWGAIADPVVGLTKVIHDPPSAPGPGGYARHHHGFAKGAPHAQAREDVARDEHACKDEEHGRGHGPARGELTAWCKEAVGPRVRRSECAPTTPRSPSRRRRALLGRRGGSGRGEMLPHLCPGSAHASSASELGGRAHSQGRSLRGSRPYPLQVERGLC
mmetsp:Transcript_6508/g.18989  ORF Transcript_6508/g.18989 Transcript_6508/m.18989 type:complete len:286 (-) Transcript_6508:1550-2407(-)